MKKGLLKSLLCFALAGTLLFGDAGLTLAAVSNDVQPAKQTQQVKSNSTASVNYVYAYAYSGSIEFNFNGYGSRFEVYVNDVLCKTISNDGAYGSEVVAPWYSDSDYLYVTPQMGATYTIKIVPYTTAGVAGTPGTYTLKREFPSSVYSSYVYGDQTPVYDAAGLTTGYGKVYVYGMFYTYENDFLSYEIYRSEKKNGTYKKVGTASGSYNISWNDNTVTMGKTYYYKVRPFTTTDVYVSKVEYGAYSAPIEVVLDKPTAQCEVAYTEAGVVVNAYSHNLATGFDVYRATKKSGKYTKIATTSDTYYIDTTAKSGKTYYYKLKPFFYNTETKKTTYGSLSDAAGVKVNLSSGSYLEITQTAKNKVKLQWDKVKGATSYEIYKKSDIAGEGYKYVGSTKKTTYTAKVTADAYTSFRVRAVKKANSIKSEYLVMTGSIDTGFTAPRNLEVSKKSTSIKNSTMTIKTTLKWDKVYGAKKYRVEVYNNEKNEWVAFKTITKTTITISNTKKLNGSWKYDDNVRVYAVKGDEEEYSNIYCLSDLAAVTGVKVTKNNATSAKVSWKEVKGADTYTVYRRTPTGDMEVYIGETTKTSFVDKKLTPGVNYTYYVTARNSKYYAYSGSAYDEDKEVYTNQAIYNHKVAAPKISKASNSAAKKATIKWGKVDGATKYVVYRATSKNGTYKKVKTVTGTSFTDSKLTKGKTYYYKVVAVTKNDAGITVESAKSAAKSVKIKK